MNPETNRRPASPSLNAPCAGEILAPAATRSAEPADWQNNDQARSFRAMDPQAELWALADGWNFRLLV
jgi:hypothetical protein